MPCFLWTTALLLAVVASSIAQPRTVRGSVTDLQTGQALPGAHVLILGNPSGAVADHKGHFSLTSDTAFGVLSVSFVGYTTVEVPVRGQDELRISLQAANLELSEVTVTAYESNRKLIESAGSIGTLSARDINRFDNASILPVLNTVPGVRMESQVPGGNSRLSIRGSLLRSPFGVRGIKVYWNDIPYTAAGGTTNYEIFEPAVIGRMEILKGPSGSIYGAGTGGVILMQTARSAYNEQSAEVSAMAGAYGLARYSAFVRSGTDKANVTLSYTDQTYGGYREVQGGSFRKTLNLTALLYPSDKRTVTLNVFRVDSEFEIPGALTRQEYDANPRQVLPIVDSLDSRLRRITTNFNLGQQYQLSENLSNSTAVYGNFGNTDHPFGISPAINTYLRSSFSSVGGRSRFTYTPRLGTLKSRFTAGVELQRDFSVDRNYRNLFGKPGPLTIDNELTATQYILFGQAEVDLPREFVLTAGVSYNNLAYHIVDLYNPASGPGSTNDSGKLTFDPSVAPRLALVKKLTPAIAAHGSVSYGFGPPTSGEISPAGRFNTGLKAERGVNYEAGIRGAALKNRLGFDITGFLSTLDNIIVRRVLADGGDLFENAGRANQNGIEATCSYVASRPDRAITLFKPFLSYTFHDFRFARFQSVNESTGITSDFSGNRIPGISPHVAVGGLDVETKVGVYAHLTYSYFAQRQITNANDAQIGSYDLLAIRAGLRRRIGRFGLELFAGLDNALNEKYVSFLDVNAFGGRYFHPAPDRNGYGGVSLKYWLLDK